MSWNDQVIIPRPFLLNFVVVDSVGSKLGSLNTFIEDLNV